MQSRAFYLSILAFRLYAALNAELSDVSVNIAVAIFGVIVYRLWPSKSVFLCLSYSKRLVWKYSVRATYVVH
jgi:hypothetical protein